MSIEEYIEKLLENALDSGIKELEFWEMTIGEVIRAIESKNRLIKIEAKEKASYDYILANLIAKGVSLAFGGRGNFPTIEEAYSSIFQEEIKAKEKEIEEQRINLSVLRFQQFAQSYNKRYENNKEVRKTE